MELGVRANGCLWPFLIVGTILIASMAKFEKLLGFTASEDTLAITYAPANA